MLPIVHNIWELEASELERYFRDHREPLVRALAERLQDSEAELERLRIVEGELENMEDCKQYWQDEFEAEESRYNRLSYFHEQMETKLIAAEETIAKLERKLNEHKRSA